MANVSYLVRTFCATYNHESYITDALKGFVMQETSFPVVYTIVDDASTDKTAEVLRQFVNDHFVVSLHDGGYDKDTDYGHVTFARHKTNTNCFFAVIYLKENHYSQKKSKAPYLTEWMDTKYIALCEGDDYWIDPLKLQKQVDFLEAHNEYSLCCHRYKIYNQNNGTWDADYVKELFDEHPDGFSFSNKENLNTWITKTLSLVYRRDCYDSKDLKKYKYTCDEHSCYHMLKKGMGYCFPFFGGVYRRCDVGVYSTLSPEMKEKRFFLIRAEMLQYNLEDKELRNVLFVYTRENLSSHILYREMRIAAMTCLQSFYRTDGFWTMLRAVWKFLKSYVYGLKTKKRE